MSSPFFTLKDFTLEHYNPYSVNLEYPFFKDGQIQIRTHKILAKGDNIPNRKSIKFTEKQIPKQDLINLKFYYISDEAPFMTNTLLKTYAVTIPHLKEEQYTLVLQFYMDSSGIPHLDKAFVNETYYEDAPVKKTATTTTTTNTTENKDSTENKDTPTEEKKPEKIKKDRTLNCIIKVVECLFGLPQDVFNVK
jgi:hypothetical protein